MKSTLKVLTGALLFCSIGIVLQGAAAAPDTTLEEIAQYRQWTRVTEKPLPIAVSAFGGD